MGEKYSSWSENLETAMVFCSHDERKDEEKKSYFDEK